LSLPDHVEQQDLVERSCKFFYMIELRRLRLLRELEARGTITAVARALSYTPSAVSQQLAQLERDVGIRLLERVGRGVRLTDAGHTLAAHAREILAATERAEAELAAQEGSVSGRLRVGTFQSAALALLAPALKTLADDHPQLEIETLEADPEETMPALLVGDLDLVCGDDYDGTAISEPAIDREDLLIDELRLVLPRNDPLAARTAVRLADLTERNWASGRAGSAYAAAIENVCRERASFTPRVHHRASDLVFILSLVHAAGTVALLPDLLGADQDPRVAVRPLTDGAITRTIYTAVRRSSAQRPAIIAVRDTLRTILAKPPRVLSVLRTGEPHI
jgi:DNA-binding transcriptional LysR family regulator